MARGHRGHHGHVGTHRSLPSHGVKHDKELHKGGPRYTGKTETHHALGGMPREEHLDPPNRSLPLRDRTGHGSRAQPRTHADRRLGYTR